MSVMRRRNLMLTVVQVLFGVTMLVVGVLKFIKPDFKVAENVTLQAFIDSGWLWPLIGGAEAVGGAAVASGRYVPIGLAVLAPVVAGILAFAIKTGGEESSVGVILLVIHLWLSWKYRASFRSLTKPHAFSTPEA
jgi:putative oxidoreductase